MIDKSQFHCFMNAMLTTQQGTKKDNKKETDNIYIYAIL